MSIVRKGLPIPTRAEAANGRPEKYPWSKMAVGDAFPVHIHDLSNVRACAKGYGARHGKRFLVAKADGTEDYWCWRLA